MDVCPVHAMHMLEHDDIQGGYCCSRMAGGGVMYRVYGITPTAAPSSYECTWYLARSTNYIKRTIHPRPKDPTYYSFLLCVGTLPLLVYFWLCSFRSRDPAEDTTAIGCQGLCDLADNSSKRKGLQYRKHTRVDDRRRLQGGTGK